MIGDNIKTLNNIVFYACLLCLLLLACLGSPVTRAESPPIAVLYPDIREPFRSIFTTISDGIREETRRPVLLRAFANDESAESLDSWLRAHDAGVAVILGSRAPALSDALSATTPVVIGAVHMSEELVGREYYGITLNPDPEMMLRRLRTMAPAVNRVTVIYHRERDQWLIDRAGPAAERLGITLNAIAVERLQDAASNYQQVLRSQHSGTDALWLSPDSSVLDEQAVLPMILKEAWDRRLIVFSSNPAHVRRGLLFAMYPDNHGMGRSLGEIAMRVQDTGMRGANGIPPRGMDPIDRLLTAFNVRTAGRLGIRYSRDDLSNFDLVFPQP